MAKLKRDERTCPFCAETVKSVAIRCRYCHADLDPQAVPEPQTRKSKIQRTLPGVAASPAADLASPAQDDDEPVDAVPDVTDEPADDDVAIDEVSARESRLRVPTVRSVRALVTKNLTAVLAGLVVLAALGVGVSWWRAEQPSMVAPNGALVGEDARTQVLVEAADLTQRALSYDYKTLDQDMELARGRMTPSFKKEYDSTMSQVSDNTVKNKITLQAAAVSSAIIDATEHRAKVLVFLNQTTTAGTGKDQNQQLNRNSVVVTLTRGDGDWLMSKLTALG